MVEVFKDDRMSDEPQNVRIYYERSTDFRTIYAAGAYVAVTPQLNIQLSTFNDLVPTPDATLHKVNATGGIETTPVETVVKQGLMRETQVCIIMTPDTPEKLIGVLQETLKRLNESKIKGEIPVAEGQK